jgi:hypothetical protein
MTKPDLGSLIVVDPKEVWSHEAQVFTPWLLNNPQVLEDLLGMELELEVAEHPVGDFSLDLRGRDLSDNSVIIVENQLSQSDHGHLGQILTYAGGTSPSTIVWITTGFRPEHRAALDWLNEHTDPDTRFFGVEIEVVQIAGSPPRPELQARCRAERLGEACQGRHRRRSEDGAVPALLGLLGEVSCPSGLRAPRLEGTEDIKKLPVVRSPQGHERGRL